MGTTVVKSNEFEKLLEKINAERETEKSSELNVARRLEILKKISSVYFFLRVALKMPYRAISVEELEVAEAKLRTIAQENIKKFWPRFWNALGRETCWNYYLRVGYFVDDYKNMKIFYWSAYPYEYQCYSDDIDRILRSATSRNLVPPNSRALLEEMFEKKYGAGRLLTKNHRSAKYIYRLKKKEERKMDEKMKEKIEEFKARAAIGLLGARIFFQSKVLPKVQEVACQAAAKIEELIAKGNSLEACVRATRARLIKEGLSEKDADAMLQKIVKRAKSQEGGKANE